MPALYFQEDPYCPLIPKAVRVPSYTADTGPDPAIKTSCHPRPYLKTEYCIVPTLLKHDG